MDFYLYNNNFCVRNCVVPSCQGQHFIKFTNGRAKIPTLEFFEIERHYKRNIVELCGPACPNKNLCLLHQKSECFKFFSDYIRDRNISRNDIVTKILTKKNSTKCVWTIGALKYMKQNILKIALYQYLGEANFFKNGTKSIHVLKKKKAFFIFF